MRLIDFEYIRKVLAGNMIEFRSIARSLGLALLAVMAVSLPASAYDFKPEIVDALNRKDTAQVLALIDSELKLDPNYAPLYLLKGQIFFARNQTDEALEQFELALKKKSKLYEALYYKGLVMLEKDNLKEAEKAFNKGVKKAKIDKALFHNGKGLLHLKMEQYDQADVEFRKATQVGPDRAEFHANLGDANYFSEVYALAISEYNKVIEMDTTNLDIYFRLARAYVAQGQYNEALSQLSIVLTRDSAYGQAWKEAGRLYTMAGLSAKDKEVKEQRFKEAIGSYRKYLELTSDSTDGETFFNLGRSYFNLSGFAQADSAFGYVLSLGDVPKNIYLYLGRGYIGEERYQEGIEFFKKHLDWLKETDPDWEAGQCDADIFRRIGDGYKAIEDFAGAAENYVRAVELDSTNGRCAVEAALAYHQLKNFPDALKYYRERIEIGPDSWNIYLNAAYCTLKMEDFEQSVEYLQKVVELDSTNEKAHVLLSNTYLYQLHDCGNAVTWTKRWLELDTTNCDAYQSMGFAYFGGTCPADYPRAVNYFKKTLKCFKARGMDNCGNSDVMLNVAKAYHLHAFDLAEANKKEESKKYFKNAFDWYNRVLKCDPGNAEAKKGVRDTEFEF